MMPLWNLLLAAPMTLTSAPWDIVEPLIGTWVGAGEGQAGKSQVERRIERALDGKFLHLRTRVVFAGNKQQPKGEVHEDWGMLSYDNVRETFVLREFYTEGFVNTFTLDMDRALDGEYIFTSESSENAPPGTRARTTITLVEDNVVEETLELAWPGKELSVCASHRLRRSSAHLNGAHSVLYSTDPEKDRAFLRDVLGLPHIDAGQGWLIFGLPPAEVAVHPGAANNTGGFYLMCPDVEAFAERMQEAGVPCSEVQTLSWGKTLQLTLPGGGQLGVYEPRHERPENLR
jgi:hypothetical protein